MATLMTGAKPKGEKELAQGIFARRSPNETYLMPTKPKCPGPWEQEIRPINGPNFHHIVDGPYDQLAPVYHLLRSTRSIQAPAIL